MRPHYQLIVWQESMKLVRLVYQVTREFPREEIYGLTNQLRRAAVSIPSNIAEGAARVGNREFIQFLNIAQGSLSEVETQLLIAKDLGYLKEGTELFDLCSRIASLLGGLMNHRRKNS